MQRACIEGGFAAMNSVEIRTLGWIAAFFILAIVAGLFGFTGIAGASAGIAQGLFVIFIALLVVSGVAAARRGRSRPRADLALSSPNAPGRALGRSDESRNPGYGELHRSTH
jgi:uncharacterized membrane protein YtjA (UPF0391 family)